MRQTRRNDTKTMRTFGWTGVCLLLLAACSLRAGETAGPYDATAFVYDQDDRNIKIVEDEQAKSGTALAFRLRARAIAKSGVTVLKTPATKALPYGRYRATFRVKMQGMLHSLGTGIRFGVAGVDEKGKQGQVFQSRVVYPNEFNAEDAYQEFDVDFEIRRPRVLAETFTEDTVDRFLLSHAKELDKAGAETRAAIRTHLLEHPGTPLVPPKRGSRLYDALNRAGGTARKVTLVVGIDRNKPGFRGATRGNSTPHASLRVLTVASTRIEAVPETSLTLRQIQAKYAWRRPGETQRFFVEMHNRSGAEQTGAVTITVRWGLTQSVTLPAQTITLANGKRQAVVVDWPIPKEKPLWGCTAEAALTVNKKPAGLKRTWFTVHPRNNAVLIPWAEGYAKLEGHRWSDPYGEKPNVANQLEYWAPTPYDAAGLVPEEPEIAFLAGNSRKLESLALQKETAEQLAAQGIATAFYLEGHGTGLKAWDLFFDNPEQVAPSSEVGRSDIFYLKRKEQWEKIKAWLKGGEQGKCPEMPPHAGFIMFNNLFPAVVDRIINGHIDLMNRVPYTTCRWDNATPLRAYGRSILGKDFGKTRKELQEITIENIRRYRKEIRAKHPRFEFGYNGGHGALMGKREDPFDFAAAKAVLDKDPVAKELLSDHGYILEEAWGHSFEVYNDYKIVARNYLRACRAESAAYKAAGGHHGHMFRDNTVQYTPDDIYQQLFSLLGGAHLCLVNYGPLPETAYDLGVYAARFSQFFWDPQLRQLEAIGDKVEVDTDADLWIAEAGFEKDLPDGRKQYVLAVINPPVTEKWLQNRYGLLPEPIREPLPMLVRVPEGYSRVTGVFHLENSPAPVVKKLAYEADGGEAVFSLPGLVTFEVVVVEFAR